MTEVLNILTRRYPDLAPIVPQIQSAVDLISASFRAGGKLLVCGNGGSAADSEHIVGELMKGFASRRPLPESACRLFSERYGEAGDYLARNLQGALPAISLVSQVSLQTAFANDVDADLVFAQQVYGYGRPGDVLLAISTSGNAANCLHALRTASLMGMKTVGLTGPGGGSMAELCDVLIAVPGRWTPEVQERHLPVYHALC